MNTEGRHLIVDIWLKRNIEWRKLKNIISDCLSIYNQKILGFTEWEFDPQGESGVFLLGASHCGIHTYPEHKYITLDVYSCDIYFNAKEFLKSFCENLKINKMNVNIIERGVK